MPLDVSQADLEAWAEGVPALDPEPGPCLWAVVYGRTKLWAVSQMDADEAWAVPDVPLRGWQQSQLEWMSPGDLLLVAWRPSMMNRIESWEGVTFRLSLLWRIERVTPPSGQMVGEHGAPPERKRPAIGVIYGEPLARFRDLGAEHLDAGTIDALRVSANMVPRIMRVGPLPVALAATLNGG